MSCEAAVTRYPLARNSFRNGTAFRADGIYKYKKSKGRSEGEKKPETIEKELKFLAFIQKDKFLSFAPTNCWKIKRVLTSTKGL